MTMIDADSDAGRRAIERLERELVAWLTTVTPDGQPQTLPVWFVWEHGTILIYSKKVAVRNRNLRLNPKVSFHLADHEGGSILEIEGEAALDPDAPPSKDHAAYSAKYAELLARYGWTPEYLSAEYPHPYRIVPTIVRSF
jgi:PPOX class probable F420-dependent enzyme